MTLKLALGNVRRCARDYAVYFVTIALGVALFYAFNAISDQSVLYDALNADSLRMIDLLNALMGLFSFAVACVLGFLVVYANRFLLRRRRHEFGMYLLLGMRPGQVSLILACETMFVGLGSLVVGLVVGIALSQALAFVTAGLLSTTMVGYQFIVSNGAILFTIFCFAVIFLVSAAIDVIYVRRSKLASLLSPRQASENIKILKPGLSAVLFVVAVAILAAAYWEFSQNKLMGIDVHFYAATVLCLVGTVLFFWSASGFVVGLLQRSKNVYLRGLTAFTTRQITSKMATAFASMSVICFILFLALTTTCVGFGMVDLFAGNIKEATQFDATIHAQPNLMRDERHENNLADYQRYSGDLASRFSDNNPDWNAVVKSANQIDYYATDFTFATLLNQIPNVNTMQSASTLDSIMNTNVSVLSVSQYNANCALIGRQGIELGSNECAVNNVPDGYEAIARALIDNSVTFDVCGTSLHFAGSVQHQPMRTSAVVDVTLEVIVPDAAITAIKNSGALPTSSALNVMYSCDRATGDEAIAHAITVACPPENADATFANYEDSWYAYTAWPLYNYRTGLEMVSQAGGLRMCITYLALYIGFVLMMATAAILAIQQLSECSDSQPRYRAVSIIGASERLVTRSLRRQTLLYFLAPLGLAICHTVCAVWVINETIFEQLGTSIAGSVALAVVITIATYGVYLLVSYFTSRQMTKAALA